MIPHAISPPGTTTPAHTHRQTPHPHPDNPANRRRNRPHLSTEWQQLFQRELNHPAPTTPRDPNVTRDTQPPLRQPRNEPCGDPFSTDFNGMWIWSNNANTLLMRDDFSELHELCIALHAYSPAIGIIALQEINLDTLQTDIRSKIESVFKQHFGAVRLVTSTSPIQAPHAWKPGGTLLAVVGHWSHSVLDTSADELGRWSRVTLGG